MAWYALYTRHQHEKRVHQILTGKGFEAFLPLYTDRSPVERPRQASFAPPLPVLCVPPWTPRPLAPSPYHSRRSHRGGIRGTTGEHIPARRSRRFGGWSRVLSRQSRTHSSRCGDRVRVTAGPLRGLEGILLRKKNWCKLLLSVEMLQRSVAVEVDAAMVQRVGGRSQVLVPGVISPGWSSAPA